ncbi:MAG: AAA family ATPase [Halothiobacillaceae bacterium]|nr:MAG: AAA family ATPase [Halothiobacillaceae bacterium]
MAVIYPDLSGMHASSLGQAREFEVVRALGRDLPGDHAVFHGVMWSSVHEGSQRFGEIDVIVLAPNGHLVLLEVKAGAVVFSEHGVHKRYDDRTRDVAMQTRVQHAALRQRLKEEGLRAYVAQFLVLPDMTVERGVVAYPRERILDREDMRFLAEHVRSGVPEGRADRKQFKAMRRFLDNVLELAPDPTARMGWLNDSVQALSEGLATWATRIRSPGGLFVVRATAGAGKTQLALRIIREALERGQRVRYACFNRPLADQLRLTLADELREHDGLSLVTFHELAIGALRAQANAPLDFTRTDTFKQAEQAYCASDAEADSLDVLIIDEGQDFHPDWIGALLRQRRTDGRAYVLMDEAQRLYLRDGADARSPWSGAVEIECLDNFRTPRRIVQVINAFNLAGQAITARCPVDGEMPGFHRWEDGDEGGMEALEGVVHRLLDEGIPAERIVVLGYAGRERSRLLQCARIAGLTPRRFLGEYDADGQPLWSEGSLMVETLHRFKGQAAPVVILCEVDFDKLDPLTRHRLFVGMTRAQWRLEIVLSPRAEQALMTAFGH